MKHDLRRTSSKVLISNVSTKRISVYACEWCPILFMPLLKTYKELRDRFQKSGHIGPALQNLLDNSKLCYVIIPYRFQTANSIISMSYMVSSMGSVFLNSKKCLLGQLAPVTVRWMSQNAKTSKVYISHVTSTAHDSRSQTPRSRKIFPNPNRIF